MKRNNKIVATVCKSFGLNNVVCLLIMIFSVGLFSSCLPEDKLLDTNYIPVTVETSEATLITYTSAKVGGVISAPQNRKVTRGVCWSTHANPILDDYKTNGQGGIGVFSFSLTGLLPGTTYYARAYATNGSTATYGSETVYGNQVSIVTIALAVPTITTVTISEIMSTTAISGGTITSDGGATVTARGVCWSTNQNPTITDNKTNNGTGTNNFISSITGLTPGTTYYIRAYATNSVGTAYGAQLTTTTIAVLSVITTSNVSDITATSATSGGNITSNGGALVTARGVCWSTTQNPTTTNSKTSDGTGIGSFTSSITGLTPGTTYYIKAYATNSVGTAYGNQLTITTIAILPTVTTTTVSNITSTTATSGGTITSDGGALVTARGVCWATTSTPTTANSKTTDGTGIGSFTSSIIGLAPGTTYYIRAYATNSVGTAYGNQITITIAAILSTITTTSISNITLNTAISGGTITSDGGALVTARGVCWATTSTPTTANSKTTDGTGIGSFTSSLSGLIANTTYYIRAYATNSSGTAYGAQINFTTDASISVPSLITTTVSAIGSTTATSGGTISSDGGALVTARGICLATTSTPTTANSKTTDGTGIGSFTSSLSGLIANTTYYIRAYATNSSGTAYGNQVSFTTTSGVLAIGQSYQGGIIAYILQPSDPGYVAGQTHGLIAAPSDISTNIYGWYNGSNITTGATGIPIGTGNTNTNNIVSSQGAGSYAAKLCYDLVLGGYSDWYLPSKDELNKLFINRVAIGGFVNYYYWSSTEISYDKAWDQYFYSGAQNYYNKSDTDNVRAVRSF